MKFNKKDYISKKLTEEQLFKVQCKFCGRKKSFYPCEHRDMKICDWCAHPIYRNQLIELREELKKKGIKYEQL